MMAITTSNSMRVKPRARSANRFPITDKNYTCSRYAARKNHLMVTKSGPVKSTRQLFPRVENPSQSLQQSMEFPHPTEIKAKRIRLLLIIAAVFVIIGVVVYFYLPKEP